MKRMLIAFATVLVCVGFVAAQSGTLHEVPGLKITAPKVVDHDSQFVTINAETKGQVKWLVLSTSHKLKYKVSKDGMEVDVGIPPEEGIITVFAVAVIDGKPTDFVRTDIAIRGPPGPGPSPGVKLPLHVTIVEDTAKRTPEIRDIIESTELRRQISALNGIVRVYSKADPKLKERGFDKLFTATTAYPILIVQDGNGALLFNDRMPMTQRAILDIVNKILAGGR